MADSTTLRTLLNRVDGSAPGIQKCAGAMMKLYDRSASVAVVEWRNSLHNSRRDQRLPLLYVANEVLQNSKRNRGNKFLEAFSPILGQSLSFVCRQEEASVVEKIRRTVKIWGDRRVFSVRFVNELLKGLEPYRQPNRKITPARHSPEPEPRFSPQPVQNEQPTQIVPPDPEPPSEEEDPMDLLKSDDEEADDDDDDDNLFSNADGGLKLDVEIDFDAPEPQQTKGKSNRVKRRRSSTGSTGSNSARKSRRKAILSTTALLELWKKVASLQQSFDHSQATLSEISPSNLKAAEELESLVGDELVENYRQLLQFEERLLNERTNLHRIAQERRALEQEAIRYLPWLENSLHQDTEDTELCEDLERKLLLFKHVHGTIRKARDDRIQEEIRYKEEQEAKERKRKEEEENIKFRESALSKETEAKPGMVWNKVTQEYQYLNTEEDWRD